MVNLKVARAQKGIVHENFLLENLQLHVPSYLIYIPLKGYTLELNSTDGVRSLLL